MIASLLCNVLTVSPHIVFPSPFSSSFSEVLKQSRQRTGRPGRRAPLIEVAYFWRALIFGRRRFRQSEALSRGISWLRRIVSHTSVWARDRKSPSARKSPGWSTEVGPGWLARKTSGRRTEVGRLQAHARKSSGASEVARLAQGYFGKSGAAAPHVLVV